MKKRKELDALVPNGKLSKRPKKVKKINNNAHQLLDTDTSDMDDFSILRFRRGPRKKSGGSRLCAPCLPLCLFVLITTSIVALGTFLWLHLGLREDLDLVRAHLQKVEAQYKETPEALHDYHVQLRFLESNVSLFGDELKKINAEIGTIKKDVEILKQTSTEIKASIAAAPEIKTLPKDVESLSESVASIGSKITALESLAKDLKEQQATFAATADSISKQQEVFKENIQGILNVTNQASSYTRQDSEAGPTLASTLSSQQMSQVTDAIAQLNSTFAPKMTEVDQLQKFVDSINTSVATLEGKFHHSHELMHTLKDYVYDNLTQRVSYLEEHDYNADPIHEKMMQQLLSQKLSQALNSLNSNLSSSNESDSWVSLLGDANQMVGLYMQLYRKISPGVKFPLNGTEAASQLLNTTLSGLFKEHKGDIQKIQNDLQSLSNSCESAVTLLSRNITQVSQSVNQLASKNGMMSPGKPPLFYPNLNGGQEDTAGSRPTLPSLQPHSNKMASSIVSGTVPPQN